MPTIKRLIKDKFEKGLISAVDNRDIPEEGLANATNVSCDVLGKVRQMGNDKTHESLSNVLAGNVEPGYGLFAFNADRNVAGEDVETKMLAICDLNTVSIYDGTLNQSEITLGSVQSNVHPNFFYAEGALRVCDSTFTNTANFPKKYSFIDKVWFYGLASEIVTFTPDWKPTDQYCYPPSIANSTTSGSAHNLEWNTTLSSSQAPTAEGNISLQVAAVDTAGDGQWQKDSGLKFGISFTYEGGLGEDQESPITVIPTVLDTSGLTNIDHSLTFTLKVKTGSTRTVAAGAASHHFDPRIIGCKIWWCADADGDFADPLFIIDNFWGRGTTDSPKSTTHEGVEQAIDSAGSNIARMNALKVRALPVSTYSMMNTGQLHTNEYECAKYKSAVIINRRAFIGNVQQFKFDRHTVQSVEPALTLMQPSLTAGVINPDRMISSPIGKYDIFDEFSVMDANKNDGDHIVALASFGDRLVQFKTESIFIIGISGELDTIEAEHQYMGITYPYQFCNTEYGLAWVNKNGCYLLDKEGVITNLIEGIIDPNRPRAGQGMDPDSPEGWAAFMGDSGMIGYLPEMKQLIVFEDPAVNGAEGNIYVYDFQTNSWTRGADRVTALPKTNIITNYEDKCLYGTMQTVSNESFTTNIISNGSIGESASWTVGGLSGSSGGAITTTTNSCQLLFDIVGNNIIKSYQDSYIAGTGAGNWALTGTNEPFAGLSLVAGSSFQPTGGLGGMTWETSTGGPSGIYLGTSTGNISTFYKSGLEDGSQLRVGVEYEIAITAAVYGVAWSGSQHYVRFGGVTSSAFAIGGSASTDTITIRVVDPDECLLMYTTAVANNTDHTKVWSVTIKPKQIPLHAPFIHVPSDDNSTTFSQALINNVNSYVNTDELNISDISNGQLQIDQPSNYINGVNKFYGTVSGASLVWRTGTGYQAPVYSGSSVNIPPMVSVLKKTKIYKAVNGAIQSLSFKFVRDSISDASADTLHHWAYLTGDQANIRDWMTNTGSERYAGHPYMKIERAGASQATIYMPLFDKDSSEVSNSSIGYSIEGTEHSFSSFTQTTEESKPTVEGYIYTAGDGIVTDETPRDGTVTMPAIIFKANIGDTPGQPDQVYFDISIFGDWTGHFNFTEDYVFAATGLGTLNTALGQGIKFNIIELVVPAEYSGEEDPNNLASHAVYTRLVASYADQSSATKSVWSGLRSFAPTETVTVTVATTGSAGTFDDTIPGIPNQGKVVLASPNRHYELGGSASLASGIRYMIGVDGQNQLSYSESFITQTNSTGFSVGTDLAQKLADINNIAASSPWLSVQQMTIGNFKAVVSNSGTRIVLSNTGNVSESPATSGSTYIAAPLELALTEDELLSDVHNIDNDINLPALGLAAGDIIELTGLDGQNWSSSLGTENQCVIKDIVYDGSAKTCTINIGTSAGEGADGSYIKHILGPVDGTYYPYGYYPVPTEYIVDSGDRDFATTAGGWVPGAGAAVPDTYNESGDMTFEVTSSGDAKWSSLDGDDELLSIWRNDGYYYRLTYSINIRSYSAGTLRVGMSNDSHVVQVSNNYTAVTGGVITGTLDFALTAAMTKVIVYADASSTFAADFDNFSFYPMNSAYATMKTSTIRLKGNPNSTSSLNLNTWVTQNLNIREFINNEDSGQNPTAGTDKLVIETPDYALGDSPHTRKSIYKVSMTTKSSGRFSLSAAFNGEPDFRMILSDDQGQFMSSYGSANKWTTQDFYFTSDKSPIKQWRHEGIKSIRLKIKSVGNLVGFQLNDITISYRELDR